MPVRALLLLLALPALAQEPAAGKPPLRVLRTGGLRVETAALLMSGQEGGNIPVAALAIPFPGEGRARIAVLLEMDGAEVMEGQTGDLLRLEVCLYAVAGAGRVAGSRMDTVEIDLARLGADLEKSGLKYVGDLQLAPGEYALRTLVRNAATGEVGLRVLPLLVPDFGQSQGVLLPPLVAEPAGAWLLARGAGMAPPPPGLSFDALPSARPVFSPGAEISLRVPAWRLGGIGDGDLQAEVRRPGGARVAMLPLKITSRGAGAAGLQLLTATVELQGVEEGAYELGIVSAARRPGEGALAVPFVVLERGGGGQVWAALTAPRRSRAAANAGAAARTPPAAAPRGKRTRKIDAGPVREGYRAALRRLAAGDRDGARDAMLELQTRVLTGERPAVSDDLVEVVLDVSAGLARRDPESLVPILTLHQVLYREAVRKSGFLLSTHNRELVFRLVDLYAERSGSAEGKRRAAGFLMGLAAEMVWSAPPSLRARVFQQILAYDGRQEAAILCLAVDAERQGRYADAVGYLQRMRPGHGEARLRLAVNLARLGKRQEARTILREASEPAANAEPWLLAVAWQETARLQIAAGELEGAERTLRDGLQRLPDDDKLALQLGLVRDLRKDPRGAREAVAGLGTPGKTPGTGGAARHRYNQLPLESLDQAWIELQEQAVGRIPALAALLGVPAAGEAPRNTP